MVQGQEPPGGSQGFCVHCGKALEANARFCAGCGATTDAQPGIRPHAQGTPRLSAQAYVPGGVFDDLPSMVRTELGKLTPERQSQFLEEYERRRKKTWLAYVLLVLTLHYAYLGKWGVNLIFWGTFLAFGVGFIWWLIDIVRTYGMVKDFNRDVSIGVLRDLKIMIQD